MASAVSETSAGGKTIDGASSLRSTRRARKEVALVAAFALEAETSGPAVASDRYGQP